MKHVTWKVSLKSDRKRVFEYLTTQSGREQFWAEKAPESNGYIHFAFPNGFEYASRIVENNYNKEFQIIYFDSVLKITLKTTELNGTILTLVHEGIKEEDYCDTLSGWVSVLMNLKAVVDYEIDLRNHQELKTWTQRFVEN